MFPDEGNILQKLLNMPLTAVNGTGSLVFIDYLTADQDEFLNSNGAKLTRRCFILPMGDAPKHIVKATQELFK